MTTGSEGTASSPPAGPRRRTTLVLVVGACVLVLDQLTKLWAVEALATEPVELIGPLRLSLTGNTAGAFGLGGGLVPFLAVAAVVLVVVLATRSEATSSVLVAVAAGLVLGGAFGNLIDRMVRAPGMLRGAVVDFIDVGFWPVFNLADAAITCGCVLLIWSARSRGE